MLLTLFVGLVALYFQKLHPYPDTLAEDMIVYGMAEPQLQTEAFCQVQCCYCYCYCWRLRRLTLSCCVETPTLWRIKVIKQLRGHSVKRRPECYVRTWSLLCVLLQAFRYVFVICFMRAEDRWHVDTVDNG